MIAVIQVKCCCQCRKEVFDGEFFTGVPVPALLTLYGRGRIRMEWKGDVNTGTLVEISTIGPFAWFWEHVRRKIELVAETP